MLLCPRNFPGKSTGEGCHFPLQRIFLAQGSNPGLPHCRQMLYHLCHQGSLTGKCDAKCDVSQTDFPTCHSTSIPDSFTLFPILANCNFILHFSQKPELSLSPLLLLHHISNLPANLAGSTFNTWPEWIMSYQLHCHHPCRHHQLRNQNTAKRS